MSVTPDKLFTRKGDNLSIEVPVTFHEAALGADIAVPVPRGGTVKVRIPAGTANGRAFRIKGKGIRGKNGVNHDVLAVVEVSVPESLSEEARVALDAFAAATTDHDPRQEAFAAHAKAATS